MQLKPSFHCRCLQPGNFLVPNAIAPQLHTNSLIRIDCLQDNPASWSVILPEILDSRSFVDSISDVYLPITHGISAFTKVTSHLLCPAVFLSFISPLRVISLLQEPSEHLESFNVNLSGSPTASHSALHLVHLFKSASF